MRARFYELKRRFERTTGLEQEADMAEILSIQESTTDRLLKEEIDKWFKGDFGQFTIEELADMQDALGEDGAREHAAVLRKLELAEKHLCKLKAIEFGGAAKIRDTTVIGTPAEDAPTSVAAPHNALIAEAEMEEPEEGTINNAMPSPCRGRKQKLDDMECLKIYRQHYEGNGLSIATLAKEYDWSNSPFADTPKFETAKSRINKALKRGRELTPPHARPANDKAGRE